MKHATPLLFAGLAALATSACGIKGPLTLPERSESIVIRAPGTPAAGGDAAPSAPAETPSAAEANPQPAQPQRERMPPPPLPSSNPGTGRSG